MKSSLKQKPVSWRILLQAVVVIFVAPFIPLIISNQWNWWQAWVYAFVSILAFVLSRLVMVRRHPDLVMERAHSMQATDAQPWDRWIAPLIGIGSVSVPLIAGLEHYHDLGWTLNAGVSLLSLTGIILGYAFSSWALAENAFFSGVVRLQTERGHSLVDTGPYGWIRHPGYAGGLLVWLCTPCLLGSGWAWIPTGLLVALTLVRTALEDTFLQHELAGYREYARKVKYRLLPGIW